MKKLAIAFLVLLLTAGIARADLTLTDSNMESVAVSGNVTTGGTCSITHVSHIGDLTTTAEDVVTLTDYAQVGTPTLAVDATCNQVATTGTPAGDGDCGEEEWIALTGSPFDAYMRLHRTNGSPLFDLATETFYDVRDRSGNDIGAYNHGYGMLDLGGGDLLRAYRP